LEPFEKRTRSNVLSRKNFVRGARKRTLSPSALQRVIFAARKKGVKPPAQLPRRGSAMDIFTVCQSACWWHWWENKDRRPWQH